MIWPVKKVFITQEWGVNPKSYARFGLKGHNGLDLRAFLSNGERCYEGGKSEVFSPHDGECLENGFDADGYGWYVKIENEPEGSILAHLSSQSPLKVGQTVKQGEFVGFQGTTGNSTGIHLHWGYYRKPRDKSNGYSGTTDPKPFIEENIKMYTEAQMTDVRLARDKNWDLYQEELKTANTFLTDLETALHTLSRKEDSPEKRKAEILTAIKGNRQPEKKEEKNEVSENSKSSETTTASNEVTHITSNLAPDEVKCLMLYRHIKKLLGRSP